MRRMSYGIALTVLVASLAVAGARWRIPAMITDRRSGRRQAEAEVRQEEVQADEHQDRHDDRRRRRPERHAAEGVPVGGRIRQAEHQVQPRTRSPVVTPSQIATATTEEALAAVATRRSVPGSRGQPAVRRRRHRQDFDARRDRFQSRRCGRDPPALAGHRAADDDRADRGAQGLDADRDRSADRRRGGRELGLQHLGRPARYVQARCKNKTIKYNETFSFTDAPDATASDTQPCKQKKPKK